VDANTAVDKVAFRRSNSNDWEYECGGGGHDDEEEYDYIPIKVGANTTQVIWFNDALYEQYQVEATQVRYTIDVAATGTFPVEAGSGYRIFYNWVSEADNEEWSIEAIVKNVNPSPYPYANGGDVTTFDGNPFEGEHDLIKIGKQSPASTYIDIRVPDNDNDTTSIDISFRANHFKDTLISLNAPKTVRLLSMSGCLLPIESGYIPGTEEYFEVKEPETTCTEVITPATSGVMPGFSSAIVNKNDQYCYPGCDKGNQWIQDGPVVVAEEVETFSSFSVGNNRSKIVVIADSTMIQGQCSYYRNDTLGENQALIRSLYPPSPTDASQRRRGRPARKNVSRNYVPKQKLLSPERGSAAKLFSVTEIPGLVSRYGLAGVAGNLANYNDTENTFVPNDVARPIDPKTGEAFKAAVKSFEDDIIPKFGVFPRYSGVYLDAGIQGGMPEIMLSGGKDHIDFDVNYSGYPGDLFGYSIDIHNNKLVVGSPFAGYQYRNSGTENIVTWAGVQVSGEDAMMVNGNGGAGAVYYFEKTGSGVNALGSTLDWEFKQKIKPSSINVGLDDDATSLILSEQRGDHSLSTTFIMQHAIRGDQFGHSVSIDEDFLAIGAPNHGFETLHDHIYGGTAAFIRKEFDGAFDIPQHNFYNYDLGSSGVRYDYFHNEPGPDQSGTFVLNNGAVFTYRHQLTDWQNRTKEWKYAEKIFADGYSDRNTDIAAELLMTGPSYVNSGTENDFFGTSVSINRAGRGDSDYTLVVGSPSHKYGTSGDNPLTLQYPQIMEHAGAAYTFDAMLRRQGAKFPNVDNWIEADVFGDRSVTQTDGLTIKVYQNIVGDPITYETSGIIYSNMQGAIFLEASGFDPAPSGFVSHRPYVESVVGETLGGTPVSRTMNLVTVGTGVPMSGSMNLMLSGVPSAYVYNNMELYTSSWNHIQVGSGVDSDPFYLTVSGGGFPSSTLTLCMSGQIPNQEQLDLRVRGK
jgi:hypothetical protein